MKVTVEIPDEQWARLERIAATRERSCLTVLSEALTDYIDAHKFESLTEDEERERRQVLLDAKGSISDEEAEAMYQTLREGRRDPELVEAALAAYGAALRAHDKALRNPWYLDELRDYLAERERYEMRHAKKIERVIGKAASPDEIDEQNRALAEIHGTWPRR